MQYEVVERDFVSRTLAILRQYREIVAPQVPPSEEYEVTLLLNCLLGLIVVPYEHKKRQELVRKHRDHRPEDDCPKICPGDETTLAQAGPEWGLTKLRITQFKYRGEEVPAEQRTIRSIFAMLRHSMAHAQFGDGSMKRPPAGVSVRYQTSLYNPIQSVIFDVNFVNEYRGKVEFKASIPVDGLRTFTTTMAERFLAEIQQRNTT